DYAREWGVQEFSPQPVDNIKNFYGTGTTFTNTVSVFGGNERSSARLSFSNMDNKNIVPNNKLARQNITLRATHQISDRLMVDAKVNYTRQEGNNRIQNGISFSGLQS